MVSGELLVEAGGRIATSNDASDCVVPVSKFSLAQREPLAQRAGALRRARAHHFDSLEPSRDIPARHHVRKGAVVHSLVVLVRPNHVTDMPLAISLSHGARRPETRGLEQDLRSCIEEERIVDRGTPVLPHRIGDIGADVLLHPAGQDVDHRAVGTHHTLGRGLLAGVS